MTETQIRTFLLAAESGSIAKASEALFVSPPAVSKHLAALEKDLGIVLFTRSHTGISLTPGGQLLYQFFQGKKEELERVVAQAKNAAFKEEDLLRVGCREEWDISHFFPGAIRALRKRWPECRVTLDIYRDEELVERMGRNRLDLLILPEDAIQTEEHVHSVRLITIGCGLIISSHHRLADREHLDLRDFAEDKFFIIASSMAGETARKLSAKVRSRCREQGFEPSIAVSPSVASAYSQIQNDQGVIIVADWSMARANPAFRYVPLNIVIHICACWMDDEKAELKQALCDEISRQLGLC